MTYQNIIVDAHGRVGLITLNRPKALNALNEKLIQELNTAFSVFELEPDIGCVVLTGSDKAFAAGADVKEMVDKTYVDAYLGKFLHDWTSLAEARKPVIAAVAGFCLGGGCELAMMCDFIIAADTAKFGQPEITLGIMPGAGHPAHGPLYRQVQSHGHDIDRPHDGCSRSRALWPRRPCRGP